MHLYSCFTLCVIDDISDDEMVCSLVNDDACGHTSEDSVPMCSENTVEGSICILHKIMLVENFNKFSIIAKIF